MEEFAHQQSEMRAANARAVVVHQQGEARAAEDKKIRYCDGPSRELATTILAHRIEHLRRELIGMEELKKIADGMVPGSPGEVAMWELLVAGRAAERRATW